MPDAWEILKRSQLRSVKRPRYLATSSGSTTDSTSTGSSATSVPSTVIGKNVATFAVSGEAGVGRDSGAAPSGGLVATPAPYPPVGMYYHRAPNPPVAVSWMVAEKHYAETGTGFARYLVEVGMLRFDTSSLPDSARVATATLRAHCEANQYGYLTGHERSVTFDWATWTDVDADWTESAPTDAHNGLPLAEVPYGVSWIEIPLKDATTNVLTAGVTSLKFFISGGDPKPDMDPTPNPLYGGAQIGYSFSIEGGVITGRTEFGPQLIVTYE